jgi:hypothetical protein
MEVKDSLGLGELSKESVEIIKLTYPDLAQPSAKKIGTALETIFDLSNTILLPIKLLNEKSAIWYRKHMARYERRLNEEEGKEIVPVIPDIGLPILDRLTYLENDEISELFIEILVNASIKDTAYKAHPSFINILNRIGVDEARLIKYLHQSKRDTIPFILLKGNVPDNSQEITFSNRITNIDEEIELIYPQNIDLYLSNFIAMGILNEELGKCRVKDANIIERITLRNKKYENNLKIQLEEMYKSEENPSKKITLLISNNQFILTPLGKEFIDTCNKPLLP